MDHRCSYWISYRKFRYIDISHIKCLSKFRYIVSYGAWLAVHPLASPRVFVPIRSIYWTKSSTYLASNIEYDIEIVPIWFFVFRYGIELDYRDRYPSLHTQHILSTRIEYIYIRGIEYGLKCRNRIGLIFFFRYRIELDSPSISITAQYIPGVKYRLSKSYVPGIDLIFRFLTISCRTRFTFDTYPSRLNIYRVLAFDGGRNHDRITTTPRPWPAGSQPCQGCGRGRGPPPTPTPCTSRCVFCVLGSASGEKISTYV